MKIEIEYANLSRTKTNSAIFSHIFMYITSVYMNHSFRWFFFSMLSQHKPYIILYIKIKFNQFFDRFRISISLLSNMKLFALFMWWIVIELQIPRWRLSTLKRTWNIIVRSFLANLMVDCVINLLHYNV